MSIGYGIVAGLGGSIAINTGNNLQSVGMQKLELQAMKEYAEKGLPVPQHPEVEPSKSKIWIIGTIVFVTGSLLNFASYALAPQMLLASLESVQFVTNVFFGKFALGKEVTTRMYLGTTITILGTTVTVLFSSTQSAKAERLRDFIKLFPKPAFLAYLGIVAVGGGSMHYVYCKNDAKDKDDPTRLSNNVMAVLYAVVSALAGTLSVVFAKLLAEILDLLSSGTPVFERGFTYVVLVLWLILMITWLTRLNGALAIYDPLFIIPLLQANFIFFAIVSGGIYFQEFNHMHGTDLYGLLPTKVPAAAQWCGFLVGIVMIFSGLYLLAPEETSTPAEPPPSRESFSRMSLDGLKKPITQTVYDEIVHQTSAQSIVNASRSLMAGAARINEHHHYLEKDKYRKEKELQRLLMTKNLTREEANHARTLMIELNNLPSVSVDTPLNGEGIEEEALGEEEEAAEAQKQEGAPEEKLPEEESPMKTPFVKGPARLGAQMPARRIPANSAPSQELLDSNSNPMRAKSVPSQEFLNRASSRDADQDGQLMTL